MKEKVSAEGGVKIGQSKTTSWRATEEVSGKTTVSNKMLRGKSARG
jgi:hypothetical protein